MTADDDDDVGRRDVIGFVASEDPRAQAFQAPGRIARLEVGAAHVVAEVDQDLGDTAHPRAADADEGICRILRNMRHRLALEERFRDAGDGRRGVGERERAAGFSHAQP